MSVSTLSFLNTLTTLVGIGCLFMAWQCFKWAAKRRQEGEAHEDDDKH